MGPSEEERVNAASLGREEGFLPNLTDLVRTGLFGIRSEQLTEASQYQLGETRREGPKIRVRGLVPDFPTEANIARAGGLGIRHSVGFRLQERKHPCLSVRKRQTRRIPSCRLSVAAACRPQLRWKESGRAGFSGPPARGALPPPRTRRSLTQVPAAPEVGRCRGRGPDQKRPPKVSVDQLPKGSQDHPRKTRSLFQIRGPSN